MKRFIREKKDLNNLANIDKMLDNFIYTNLEAVIGFFCLSALIAFSIKKIIEEGILS